MNMIKKKMKSTKRKIELTRFIFVLSFCTLISCTTPETSQKNPSTATQTNEEPQQTQVKNTKTKSNTLQIFPAQDNIQTQNKKKKPVQTTLVSSQYPKDLSFQFSGKNVTMIDDLLGHSSTAIKAVFDKPALKRQEGTFEIWLYEGGDCFLDFYFAKANGKKTLRYADFRVFDYFEGTLQTCLHGLAN